MDTRITVSDRQSFFQILEQLHEDQKKVSLLYDNNGLTRYEGMISAVLNGSSQSYLLMHDGTKIDIPAVIAVNGIFAPDYSEC